MDKLIKDIINDTRVNNILKANGFKYVGQLLVIHEHSLMKKHNGIGKEAINIISSALYSNRYGCIGSCQAYELPSVVLRHMADLAEAEERKKREEESRFFEEHGCSRLEYLARTLEAWEDED